MEVMNREIGSENADGVGGIQKKWIIKCKVLVVKIYG